MNKKRTNFKEGRPKLDVNEKRNFLHQIKINLFEKKQFEKYGLTSNDKIREYILETFIKKTMVITSEKDPKYIKELNKIGVNLNQISKKYNSLGNLSNLDIEKINNIVEVLALKINESNS